MQNPFVGRVTSEFGPRNGKLHAGIDIAPTVPGTVGGPVFAAYGGKVVKVATKQKPGAMTSGRAPGRTGNGCVVVNPDGEKQVYNHMMPLVNKGDAVAEGQLLGHLDQSGQQSGPHLHFETWNSNGTLRDPRIDFRAAGARPGKGAPPIGRPFLPLKVDGDFGHRTITELERALARAGLYRGLIEEDRAAPAVAGPVLFTAYQKFLASRGFGVGRPDGKFGSPWVKAEQGWLHTLGFYKPSPPDGDRGKVTIKALQRALNATAI